MEKEQLSRKLAVILHADVVGSTTLVQQNEALAHERIHGAFNRFSEIINSYRGITRELRGDAILAEFDRASDAVSAALAFQISNRDFNSTLNDDIQPKLRIGVGLGEVIIADRTVTGEGVVLAQRIEQLARPGGLCITGAIHEALPQRMPFNQENLGEQLLKGFDEPVRVYQVVLSPGESIPPAPEIRHSEAAPKLQRLIVVAAVIALAIAGGTAYWYEPWVTKEEPASIERMAFPLPVKPSIAVLPFDDLSPEIPKRSLADGLTETLISTLGQVGDLFVIARNSVMAYKEQATDVREIGRQLGVRYVLEGSVQQSPDKVRVTAQLVDTATGGHLWSEQYDRPLDDIFHLQDEIALKVLVSLQVQLTDGEVARLRSSTTKNVGAYLIYQKGVDVFFTFTKEAMVETRQLMDEALKLDPNFASAIILIAWTHVTEAEYGYSSSRDRSIALAGDELVRLENLGLEKAVLARGEALMIRGYLEMLQGNLHRAVKYGEQSIALLPNHPDMTAIFGLFQHYAGNQNDAINVFRKAMRIDPAYKAWFARTLSAAFVLLEDYDAAEIAARDALERASKAGAGTQALAHQQMAIVYAQQGEVDLGKTEIRRALELAPWLSIQANESSTFFQNERDLERFISVLRTLGLPE